MSATKDITIGERSLDEIAISIRVRATHVILDYAQMGNDLIEAKEKAGHGEWLPFLQKVGISSSTAANWMNIARRVTEGSNLAKLSYSQVMAMAALPAAEAEELAPEVQDKSAAEIKKLIDERNRAMEAANIETARVKDAEEAIEQLSREQVDLREQLANAREKEDELKARLLEAENNRVEVTVPPADYEIIKGQLERAKQSADQLIEAAAEAEERAEAAEMELEALRQGQGTEKERIWMTIKMAADRFITECSPALTADPGELMRNPDKIMRSIRVIDSWCDAMKEIMEKLEDAKVFEGAVSVA